MDDLNTLILSVEYKLNKLTDQFEKMKQDNQRLLEENELLNKTIIDNNTIVTNLKDQIQKVKLAKSIKLEDGQVDAKLKINELVREIDKCIGLLNQ
ncbi:MAG: hypothetical protein GY834_14055 [Bacteroidetes bacterium]|nr:hypothetical protein [Bacteroidota bacterium]